MSFEGVVRPFQLPNSAPSQRYLAPKQQAQPPVKLFFGRSGSGRTFNGSGSAQGTWYLDQRIVEKAAQNRAGGGFSGFYIPPIDIKPITF